MEYLFNFVGVFLVATIIASPVNAAEVSQNSFSSPESVLHYNNSLFVSNVGEKLEPTNEDGDGYISMLKINGELVSKKYFNILLNAPKGMAAHNDILYVADINRVVGVNLKSKKQVFEVSLSDLKTNFLNDIAVTDEGILYVSATDTGDIYQINTNLKNQALSVSRLPVDKLPGPNGLAYDEKNNVLWIASFGAGKEVKGEFGKIDLASYKYEKVTNINGMLDGVAVISDSKVILSDWVSFDNSGKIIELDVNTGKQKVLFEKLGGPADFAYLSDTKELVIPRMIESKVTIQSVR